MGVPKFYRWISERYPCLSEVVKEYQIPEFDNLYLDMNGIIHVCSHPNDEDVVSRIPEEKIFADIFHYLEVLFRMIRPRKLFFMAVDGVAPRAKMNQQRGRRFKSAREAENREKEARAKGIEIPTEERFDSNCITPGTPFMARLHEQLNYFVVHKISTDPLWQSVKVILSGHQTPGEGEHKIMEYIRWSRAQPNHDPHTRHCLYGLDADLIMLGLCSHEPHFALLREEVKFGGSRKKNAATSRPSAPEHTTFHLLHLSLMREYLDYEFSSLKDKLTFPYDLESIIDDWVLMGFLVGNDFIPHLPNLHIHQGALPLLYEAYKAVLPKMDGYINEGGKLNLSRFQTFLGQLSSMDMEHFTDAQADLKWLEGRKGSNGYKPAQARAREAQMAESQKSKNKELAAYLNAKNAEIDELMLGAASESGGDESEDYETVDDEELSSEEEETDEENTEDLLVQEFKAHKVNYYKEKLEYAEVTEEVLRSQAEGYVRAIQWNLYYYYEGVASWSWYYPHHYAPFISDIQNFKDLKLEFELGKPFLPFQQLLGVLPPASKKLLPAAYAELMTSTLSPIYDYYPVNFLTDLNGKQQDWEALVLIPFIDETRLLEAMKPCDERLPEEDKRRNEHGPMQIYMYTPEDLGVYKSKGIYGTIVHNHAVLTELPREAFLLASPSQLVKGLHPKMDLSLFVPGFPTLKHIPHKHSLSEARVVVFQMPARGASMVLDILPPPEEEIHELAKQLLGKEVHVGWPHLIESRVVGISSRKLRLTLESRTENIVEGETDEAKWNVLDDEFRRRCANRWGILIGETQYLLHVKPLQGRQYVVTQAGRVTLEKQWSPVVASYPLQAVVRDIKVLQPLSSLSQYNSLEEMFPPQSVCFMLGHPHYGAMARVVKSTPNQKAQIKIQCSVRSEPDLRAVHRAYKGSSYMPGYMAATRVGVSSHLLSRLTGNVLLISSSGKKIGVGLNLKLNKKNQEVPGYSKRIEGQWQYSRKCIEVLKDYYDKFPRLFDFLSEHASKDLYNAKEIFGDKEEEMLPELETYVSQLECQHAERATCGGVGLEADIVSLLQEEVDRQKEGIKEKLLNLGVKPHLLYKPHMYSGSALPDPSTSYLILDRVIYVKEGFSVPVGLKGTVIGIIEATKPADSVYEVLFDEEFPGALSIKGSGLRAFRLSSSTLINISHGYRTINMYPPVAFAKAPPPQTVSYSTKIKEQPQNRGPSKTPTKAPPANNGTRKSASLLMAERAKHALPAGQQPAEPVVVPPTAESLKSLLNIGQDNPSKKDGQKETPATPLSEFEAIWLNLKKQKAQGPTLHEAAQKLPSPVPVHNAVPVMKANSTTSAAVDACSRELGKLLNISNSTTPSTAPLEKTIPVPVNPGATGRPLSLQELFQSANTQLQVPLGPPLMVPAPATNPCIELMTKCQERGWGVPMYSYLETMNGVIAKIDLPIGGGIAGPPMMDRTIAAESAANQALTHFGLRTNPLTMPLPMPIPQQFNPRFPVPPFPLTRPSTSFVPLQVQAGRQSGGSKHHAGHSPNVAMPSPARAAANSQPQSSRQHNGSVNHKNSPAANEKHVKVGQNQGRPPGKPRLAARFDMAK